VLKRIFVALTIVACAPAFAQSFDVDLSNDSAQFRYISMAGNATGFGNTEVDMGLFYSTDDDVLGMLGLLVADEAGSASPGLVAGVGVKAFAATVDQNEVIALSIGGQLRYHPPAFSRLGIAVQGHISPDVVTFVDADKFYYVSGRVEYEVLPQALVYVGYRKIRADLTTGPEVDIDNGGHIGLQVIY